MKELTIEEKAQAYDKALKRTKEALLDETISSNTIAYLQDIFPELKESDDDKIRKEILELVRQSSEVLDKQNQNNMIAWLEKQGEHADFLSKIQVGDKVTRNEGGVLVNISQLERVAKPRRVKPTDKVEPKFKVGDWVILTAGELSTTLQIVNADINKKLYWFNDKSYLPIVDEECLRHWTIEDVKDGDVLLSSDGSIFIFKEVFDLGCKHYIALAADGTIQVNDNFAHCWESVAGVCPATKEQRDTLEKAMADAGWEFDFEKKELKKIELKPAKWSEEDGLLKVLNLLKKK